MGVRPELIVLTGLCVDHACATQDVSITFEFPRAPMNRIQKLRLPADCKDPEGSVIRGLSIR